MTEGNGKPTTTDPAQPRLLTREELLRTRPRKTKVVPIPELGGAVIVQAMTARERGEFEAYFAGGADNKSRQKRMAEARERLVVESVVDESGHKLFSPADVQALGERDAAILERICIAAKELSSITAADLEEIAGN